MKIKDLIEELEEKDSYKNFKLSNPSTFFSAAFLVLDVKEKSEKIQLDFFLPEQNKVAAFEFPFGEPKIHDDEIKTMCPQNVSVKIDIDDLEPICREVIKENGSAIILAKIIAVLKDDQWNLTCMDDMFGIVRMRVNSATGERSGFSKKSLMDFTSVLRKEK